jgi:2-oxoglutarate ferredoxin oxidoreductase subunit alpha
MPKLDVSWRIGGQAGEGIDSTGEIFGYSMAKEGLHVNAFREFPSRIRGGYTSYEIRFTARSVRSRAETLDYLVAFDQVVVDRNLPDMSPGGAVIYDSSGFEAEVPDDADVRLYPVPMGRIAKDVGHPLVKNMICLGVSADFMGFDPALIYAGIERRWGAKGERIVRLNREAIERGLQHSRKNLDAHDTPVLDGFDGVSRKFMSGNEAMAFGALTAGCRFYAGYPITPATEIMEWLAVQFPSYGGVVIQTEDEISAINMAIGAGYAGARAMTGTSGPGLSLMTEALGMAGMTEVPVVIVDVQRSGPSTGLPTKPEQSDLNHMAFGSHGEAPRIILCPGSIEDAFYETAEAFNLAEEYHCPVIVASDASLGMSKATVEEGAIDPDKIEIRRGETLSGDRLAKLSEGAPFFNRYAFTESGVSPRSLPGTPNGIYTCNSTEHDETGHTTENARNRNRMMEKRLGKIARVWRDHPGGEEVFGEPGASIALVGMGVTRGPAIEAVERLTEAGVASKYVQLKHLWPLPSEAVESLIGRCERVFVVESNATGQLARILKAELPLDGRVRSILRYDGKPFTAGEIARRIKEAS